MDRATEKAGIVRRLCSQERGQVLVIAAVGLVGILALAAFAIDVASWYQSRHKAQVAADAAALAAANCMATTCASTGQAANTATSYASANGIPLTNASNVTFNNSTVTVTAPTTGASILAQITPAISARAAATWNVTDCSSPGSHCAFIFAGDNVCNASPDTTGITDSTAGGIGALIHGASMKVSGSGSPEGGVLSNSSLYTKENGSGTWNTPPTQAYAVYSNQSGCATYGGSATAPPYTSVTQAAPRATFPIDYSQVYPACPGTSSQFGSVTCDPTTGFPSYCNVVSTAATVTNPSTPNDIYCDAGTGAGVLKSTPSTWTGTINQNNALTATYIAGIVNLSVPSNSTSGPASGNHMWAYAAASNSSTQPSPASLITSSGNATITGDVFAPTGTIVMNIGGNISGTASQGLFLEGWDVAFDSNGTVAAGGPTINNTGQISSDSLVQ